MTVRVTREAEPQIEIYGAYSGELLGAGTGVRATLTFTPTDDYVILVVKGDMDEVQLEAGSFPTSYIPTTGSTATRSADIASIPVSAFGYNQDAGTVYVDGEFKNGNTIVTVGAETIDADADGERDYAVAYTSDPSATEIELNGGSYKSIKYYPRRLTNSQLQALTT